MVKTFKAEQWIPLPPPEVFAFFSNANNLELITPKWLNFHIVRISTETLSKGTSIDYQLKIRGIPVRWQSLIEEWTPHELFIDIQTKGPYKSWHHTHRFIPKDGGTLILDEVRYEVPFGGIGDFLLGSWVDADIRKIFGYRKKVIEQLLGAMGEDK